MYAVFDTKILYFTKYKSIQIPTEVLFLHVCTLSLSRG